jgi:hypothetical protein
MKSQHNGQSSGRQSRRTYGAYRYPLERRAVVAAGMAEQNGWPTKQAAGLFAVNATYVDLVRHLDAGERGKVARGELKLAQLYKNYQQRLAERRAQRLAVEQEAQEQAARQAELETVHACLDQVGLTCLVDQIVARFSEAALVDCFDLVLERRGRDLVQVVINFVGADRVMRSLDQLATPHSVAAE